MVSFFNILACFLSSFDSIPSSDLAACGVRFEYIDVRCHLPHLQWYVPVGSLV